MLPRPFHAGDGACGFTEQNETPMTCVGPRFRFLNGLTKNGDQPMSTEVNEPLAAGACWVGRWRCSTPRPRPSEGEVVPQHVVDGRSGRYLVCVQQVTLDHTITGQETGDAPACFRVMTLNTKVR